MNSSGGPCFDRYIGVDYSGARTPTSSLRGLRVFMADHGSEPREVHPPPSPRKYWTRRGVAEWLESELSGAATNLVGIDHGFSFPVVYFRKYGVPLDWDRFLEDFQLHWPTDEDRTFVEFVREGVCGNGGARAGERKWRRLTEIRAGAAKSVFHFDVQGSVAKSTHAGIPWLLYLRRRIGAQAHFWPFDGWSIPASRSAVVEVYPALWSRAFSAETRTPDQHDAWSIAEQLRRLDVSGELAGRLSPNLTENERVIAQIEGWILGVG